ncbi:HAMP domain-containing histidine kinase [bacterium]|nr:HAMP domain-containing histidine kinase [bacterium]
MELLKTLVVDDEPGMRQSIHRALSGMNLTFPEIEDKIGFDVDTAGTGSEAIGKIRQRRPDLLLLDYKLPDMSGMEILDQVQCDDNEMLIIMITAYASLETAVSAIKGGAFDFLAKPFTPAELKAAVAKAIQSLILANQVKKLAREKKQVRFQFISVLGHELKAPINAVEGYLEIIKAKTAGEQVDAYADMLNRCTVRLYGMLKLIDDLLDLTRIESGQKKREPIQVDLCAAAAAARETALVSAGERGVRIRLECEEPVQMIADAGEMEIILNNLVSNAVKYNREGGDVRIRISKGQDEVRIRVADTGLGMTPEETGRLFQEFVRIKNAETRNIPGSGLGLAIVKKIALLYQGDVTVESKKGEGSEFTVILRQPGG